MASYIRDNIGEVSILVNNAGVLFATDFMSLTDEQISLTFNVNIMAIVWVRIFEVFSTVFDILVGVGFSENSTIFTSISYIYCLSSYDASCFQAGVQYVPCISSYII